MNNLKNNSPWIKINLLIPFRICYLYFDKEPFIGIKEFKKRKIKIREKHIFSYFNFPYKGIIITGWIKDKDRIQETLNIINIKIALNPLNKDYLKFLKLWRNNILSS